MQAAYLDPADLVALQDSLRDDATGIVIHGQKLWPVGRGVHLTVGNERFLTCLEQIDFRCPCMSSPVITTNGKMFGCCSSLLDLGDSHPFFLGDLKDDDLGGLLVVTRGNAYYQFVKCFGLQALVDMIKGGPACGALNRSYTDVCHVCHDIHSKREVRNFLADRVSAAFGSPLEVAGLR